MADSYAGELAGSSSTNSKPDDSEQAERDRVLREFQSRYKQAKTHWKDWRTEAKDLYDFIAGRQWSDEDAAKLREEQRPIVTFNIAGKYMDAITGLQINNRQEIRYFPRTNGAAKVNELMTGAVSWCRDLSNMVDEETDGFYDAVLTGLGWMEGYLDKDLTPEGVAAGRRVDNMEMLPDPNARQRNLEDARFVIRDRLMDHDEYEELFGDYAETQDDALGVEDKAAEFDTDDQGLQVIPSPHDYGDSTGDTGERVVKGKCPVQDYQCWKRETRFVVTHPQAGRREMTEEEYVAQKEQLDLLITNQEPIKVEKIAKKVYYRAYFSKGKMGPYGLSPYQEGFTYHAITGKRDRNKRSWYGLGRAMVDSQNWTNKFFSTILYCLMVGAKGGILAEENAFKDSRKAESEWADPKAITWLKQGALTGENGPKIQPKPIAQYPAGLDRMMEFTMNSMPEVIGMSPELMGLQDKVQSGVLEAQRKQSAMAIIAWAFDAMRRYYRSMGRQMARYVTDYMPEGMLVKINGADSAQYVPLMKDQMALTFDVIVDEAPTSTNMRERVWAVIENLVPQLLQAGLSIPKEVLDYSPLPADLAQKWKETLEPTPDQQKGKQLEMGDKEADIKAKHAKAAKDNADAQKTMAELQRPQENGAAAAQVKAQADMQIAQMEAAIESRLTELKANKEAQTEVLIAKLKLDTEVEIARLKGLIDLKIGAMNAQAQRENTRESNATKERTAIASNATKEKIAKSRPKSGAK
jgi:hypothetical protein